MDTDYKFASWLTAARKNRRLSQNELAEKTDLSVEAISNFERGKSLPGYTSIAAVAAALDVEPNAMFGLPANAISQRRRKLISELEVVASTNDTDLSIALEQVRVLSNGKR